jgi:hypothetical protein
MEKAEDPLTGEEFYKKRSNQIFATRANQIKFNNNKAYQKRRAKNLHDRILDRSRDVLKNVLRDKEYVEKSYDFLHGAGLHFGYYTHQISKEDVKWVCIYDYAYTMVGPNLFRIIRINVE